MHTTDLKIVSAAKDFDKRATSYDDNSRWVKSAEINQIPYRFLSCRNSLGDVLDAGGGTGFLPFYLLDHMTASSITIVDASKQMLQKAHKRLPNANLINLSIESFCHQSHQQFDTILARQIFHYVDDVDYVISLLKRKLQSDGLLYVGQFVVPDIESDNWHGNFIKMISANRKRSFIEQDFIKLFIDHGYQVLETHTTLYEENTLDFYSRKTSENSYDALFTFAKDSLTKEVIKNLSIRITENNLYFTVKFCHLLLSIKN